MSSPSLPAIAADGVTSERSDEAVVCRCAVVRYRLRRGPEHSRPWYLNAVDRVSIAVRHGETLGLVGESGSGKSTLGRAIVGLEALHSGTVEVEGIRVGAKSRRPQRELSLAAQIVFQNPFGALNPHLRVGQLVAEGLEIHKMGDASSRRSAVAQALDDVGLGAELMRRRPRELSGGQRQRVAFARAIVLRPKVLIADEPTSSLDVSTQAQLLNMYVSLKSNLGLSSIFISHNLAVVAHVSDRVAVMFNGRIVEVASTTDLYERPRHPYTLSLLAAIPAKVPWERGRAPAYERESDSGANVPSGGCPFRLRCPLARDICSRVEPELLDLGDESNHLAACHFSGEVATDRQA